jgi:hypothetical protein
MRHWFTAQGKTGLLAVGAVAVFGLAAACSSSSSTSGSDASPSASAPVSTPVSVPASSSAAGSTAPTGPDASQPQPVGNGCPRNSAKIPPGARQVTTADLDLDGAADTLWLADVGSKRTLGVRTATGATFSTTFQSAAPQGASAIGQKMAPAGPAIVLVNAGRSVLLYDVADCAIVPVKNPQGAQYTFDLGFTGYGTGVGCLPTGDGYGLVGLLAAPETSAGSKYTVSSTAILLSDFGPHAANGIKTIVGTHVTSSSAVFKQAHTVSCGTPSHSVTEPQP